MAHKERGAAAVEMALVLPVLLLVLGGLIDLGRAFYTQMMLTSAAHEGARTVTTGSTWEQASYRISQAAGALSVVSASSPGIPLSSTCATGTEVTVTVEQSSAFTWTLLGAVSAIPVPTLEGKASMRCP